MTRFKISARMCMKLVKREEYEGADEINGTILVRHQHGQTLELRDPKDGKWYRYENATIPIDSGFVFVDGEEAMPSFAEEMKV